MPLSLCKGLFSLQDLGSLQVTELDCDLFQGARQDGEACKVLGMAVPLDDLGGYLCWLKSQFLAGPGPRLLA